jgi:hypothetical protein
VKKEKNSINLMFTVMLLAIFALSAIFVAMMGARVYSAGAASMQENYDTRTSLAYLSEKLRSENSDSVSVTEVAGSQAISIREDYTTDGYSYETIIFVYDGKLREVMVAKDSASAKPDFEPANAPSIMTLKKLSLNESEKGITLTVTTADGLTESAYISWRTA